MRAVVLTALLCALTREARGQELGWRRNVEVSGNVFFGAARSRLASIGGGAARADSTLEVRLDAQLVYADARDNDGVRGVTARSSRIGMAIDRHPFARVSSFWFGSVETSLQQQLAWRRGSGLGAKLTLHRAGWDDASVSLAMLWEQVRSLDSRAATMADPQVVRVRWSMRGRYRRTLRPGVRFSHVTFWQPTVGNIGRYTADSNTSLEAALTPRTSFTATLRDRFDSESRSRGARSNHDGQLLFGVNAKF